jgi:hypothetical protein
MEYNRVVHSEIHETPAERFLRGQHVVESSDRDHLDDPPRVRSVWFFHALVVRRSTSYPP